LGHAVLNVGRRLLREDRKIVPGLELETMKKFVWLLNPPLDRAKAIPARDPATIDRRYSVLCTVIFIESQKGLYALLGPSLSKSSISVPRV
jgi:hypothetical protein